MVQRSLVEKENGISVFYLHSTHSLNHPFMSSEPSDSQMQNWKTEMHNRRTCDFDAMPYRQGLLGHSSQTNDSNGTSSMGSTMYLVWTSAATSEQTPFYLDSKSFSDWISKHKPTGLGIDTNSSSKTPDLGFGYSMNLNASTPEYRQEMGFPNQSGYTMSPPARSSSNNLVLTVYGDQH